MNERIAKSVLAVAAQVRRLAKKCDYRFVLSHPSLEVIFCLFLRKKRDILLIWQVSKLGSEYPGGDYSLLDPRVEFMNGESGKMIPVPLLPLTSHTQRTRMTGKKGFFRVRGWHMPYLPLTSHFGLVKGEYQVRFKCGLQLVEGLRRYTPDYCERAAELDEILGHISVPKDFVTVEKRPINEFHYIVTRQTPRKQKRVSSGSKVTSNSANPEYYFEEHLLEPARRINRDRDKAFHPIRMHGHDSSQVGTPFVQNQRSFGGYCGSLALAYRLTGKAEYYHASRYAYELLDQNIWKTKWGWAIGLETFREGENLLEFGICAQNMFEFFKITEERKLLQKVHRVLRSWPYDKKNHLPFVELDRDGKEIHPSYPFNMVAVGCAAMWLVGEVFEDELLRSRVKETVHSFLLPMMEKDGHWQYAFHYEEKKKYPEPRGYHYDLFTKMNLSRLIEYEEWRRDHSFMNAMIKGIEFSLKTCARKKSRLLEWSDMYTSRRGPQFAINHAGLMVGYLALLGKYVDGKYVQPLEQTMRFLCSERDRAGLSSSVDWKSDWIHYHVFLPLLKTKEYGFSVKGRNLKTLRVELHKS